MTVQDVPTTVDLRKYIDTKHFGDRPHIRGRRIPVAHIVHVMRANNLTLAETAYNFTIGEAQVLAALLYYEEHKEEIEQQEKEESRLFEEMKRLHGEH